MVESAVVGLVDEIRGDCPVAYVILRNREDGREELSREEKAKLFREINEKVRKDIGPIARLEGVIIC